MDLTNTPSRGKSAVSAPARPLPELLSPAGSPEALEAAFSAGADAVYLGGSSFNARMNAHNFNREELAAAATYAHRVGGRVYLTLNTLLYDRELKDAVNAAYEAALCGVDGLIIADMGAASLIHHALPSLPLHASTQFSGHNSYAGQMLSPHGFSRFVMAREASLEDLRAAVAHSGLEVEVFIHGALCVSHSGQCLFSSLVGGRSGNRGLCAQPCRLPYRCASCQGMTTPKSKSKGEAYPLSLKDLSLARHVPALIDAGVASLKIEGRMKSPAYVGGVTSIWRRLLDEGRGAREEEMTALSELFSREGFTDGYFKQSISYRMLGVRSESDKARTTEAEKGASAIRSTPRLPLDMDVSLRAGEPLSLTVSAPLFRQGEIDNQTVTATVTGDCPEAARSAPLDRESLKKQLSRTGGTAYVVRHMKITLDEGLMVPVYKLNTLRREALEALDSVRMAAMPTPAAPYEPIIALPSLGATSHRQPRAITHTARFMSPEQIPPAAEEFFDLIYLPLDQWTPPVEGQAPRGIILPPVIFDREADGVCRRLSAALDMGARHILVGNGGHLPLVERLLSTRGIPRHEVLLHGDFRFNVCNTAAATQLLSLGVEELLLSPELTLPRLRDICAAEPMAAGAVVYGRIPLMLLEKCAIRALYPSRKDAPDGKAGDACAVCAKGKAAMVDRKGIVFPVLREYPHRNVVYNSLPLSMTDKWEDMDKAHVTNRHFIFSTESPAEVTAVVAAAKNGTRVSGEVRRIMR